MSYLGRRVDRAGMGRKGGWKEWKEVCKRWEGK